MKSRILIVEDNVTLSQMQKDWLAREGYEVTTAIDAVVARRHIRKVDFDLILSDVRLPEGDGLSLLAWLKKEKPGIPVVIMTEYASYPDAVKAIKMGAQDYLPKPVHRERLFEVVKELVHPAVTIQHSLERLFKRDSAKAREALHLAELVAPADISVLILGAERNRQGVHSPYHSFQQPKKRRAVCRGELRCHPTGTYSLHVLRSCQRRFHGCGFRQKRIF